MNNNDNIYRIGFWAGVIAFCSTICFGIVQILQILGFLPYPWDQVLIYGFSLGIVVPFILEMLVLHYTTREEKKFWSHAALIFTILYGAFVVPNYVVQLTTVIPMTMHGNFKEVSMLIQSPHSLFWDFDAIGYIFMGLATLMAVPTFTNTGLQRRVRNSFLAHALVTPFIVVVYFYPGYSETLLLLATPWIITAPVAMITLALTFRKQSRADFQQHTLPEFFYQDKKKRDLLLHHH